MTYDFYSHARIGVTRIYTREAIAQLFLLPRPCGRDNLDDEMRVISGIFLLPRPCGRDGTIKKKDTLRENFYSHARVGVTTQSYNSRIV